MENEGPHIMLHSHHYQYRGDCEVLGVCQGD